VAIHDAFLWIASGLYDIILVGGMERAASMGTQLATKTYAMYFDIPYDSYTGITFPEYFAMLAHLYAKKFNIDMVKLKEQMAWISVKAHHYGRMNPKAHLQREITVEKVLRSPMVLSAFAGIRLLPVFGRRSGSSAGFRRSCPKTD
jgi:acetyl-CoA C-acetyltransferase/acetyl-CoA acyltransferase